MSNDTTSITVKGVSVKAKDNFTRYAVSFHKNAQEMLRDYINSYEKMDENSKYYILMNTVSDLANRQPELVDGFIEEIEPMYKNTPQNFKKMARLNHISTNPTLIFTKYTEWLEAKENN